MGPGRLRRLGHPPVDAELAAPTGGGTGAAHPCGAGLGAPLEEALRAEAPGLGHGRIAHSPRGADTGSIRRLEGDDPFCGLTREIEFNIVCLIAVRRSSCERRKGALVRL